MHSDEIAVTRQLSGRRAIRNAPELACELTYLLIELGSEIWLPKPLPNIWISAEFWRKSAEEKEITGASRLCDVIGKDAHRARLGSYVNFRGGVGPEGGNSTRQISECATNLFSGRAKNSRGMPSWPTSVV